MKKSVLLIISFLFFAGQGYSQIVFANDDFDTPANWTINTVEVAPVSSVIPGANTIQVSGDATEDNRWIINSVYAQTQYVCLGYDWNTGNLDVPAQPVDIPSNNTNYLHISSKCAIDAGELAASRNNKLADDKRVFASMKSVIAFNTVGYYSVNLSFWSLQGAGMSVYYTIDDGVSWKFLSDVKKTVLWGENIIHNNDFDNQASLRFGFLWDDAEGGDVIFPAIDALQLSVPFLSCRAYSDLTTTCKATEDIVTFTNLSTPENAGVAYSWTVTPGTDGVDWQFVGGTTSSDKEPKIQFLNNNVAQNTYNVKLVLSRVLTADADLEQNITIEVLDGCQCTAGGGSTPTTLNNPAIGDWTHDDSGGSFWDLTPSCGMFFMEMCFGGINFDAGEPAVGPPMYLQTNGGLASGSSSELIWGTDIDLSSATSAELTFEYSNHGAAGETNDLDVYISNNGGGAWTLLQTYNGNTGAAWIPVTLAIPIAPTNFLVSNFRIRFVGTIHVNGTGGPYDTALSNIILTQTGSGSLGAGPLSSVSLTTGNDPSCSGNNLTFTSVETQLGGANVTAWDWKVDGSSVGAPNQDTYTTNTLTNGQAVTCEFTTDGTCTGPFESIPVIANVSETLTPHVWIKSNNSGGQCLGTNMLFTAQPTNGGSNPSYKWTLNSGATISTATTYSTTTLVDGDVVNLEMTSNITCPASNPVTDDYTAAMYDTTIVSIIPTDVCAGVATNFTINTTTATGTSVYQWTLNGGNTVVTPGYSGTFSAGDKIMLSESSSTTCAGRSNMVVITDKPAKPTTPTGLTTLCENSANTDYLTINDPLATSYIWSIPVAAGVITGNSITGTVDWINTYTGTTNITVTASNACGNSTSDALSVTVNPATIITVQPVGETKCEEDTKIFSITATGSNNNFQWYFNNSQISGATSNTYDLGTLNLSEAGNYYCWVVGDCGGTIKSNTASLVVTPKTTVTTQPVDDSKCVGDSKTFSVTATGSNNNFQWYFDNSSIAGATLNTYDIPSVALEDDGSYYCWVSGDCGTVTTNTVSFLVKKTTAVTTQPSSETKCVGTSKTFTVVADGYNISYQWYYGGTAVSGATSSTYTIASIDLSDDGSYYCIVSGDCNNVTSNTAVLTVNPLTNITTQPVSESKCLTDSKTFSVVADGANKNYQWYFTGVPIAGATSDSYSIASVAAINAGDYYCIVSSDCGTNQTSNNATLTVLDNTAITTEPASVSACAGTDDQFSIIAVGDNLSYEWKQDATVVGTNSGTLDLLAVDTLKAGLYSCTVTGTCGNLTSNTAQLTVLIKPVITKQPVSGQYCKGDTATFSVTATDVGAISYIWVKDDTDIAPIGASTLNNSFTTVVSSTSTGNYKCKATGNCGVTLSDTAVITMYDPATAINPTALYSICAGEKQTITATTTGRETLKYSWQKDSTDIAGETGVSISATTAGSYRLRVIDGCNDTIFGEAVILKVQSLDSTKTVVGSSVCSGNDANITISTSESGVLYTASLAETAIDTLTGDGNDKIFTVASGKLIVGANTFKITGKINNCTVNLKDATVTVNPKPAFKNITGDNICVEEDAAIVIQASETNIEYSVFIESTPVATATGTGNDLEVPIGYAYLEEGANNVSVSSKDTVTKCSSDTSSTSSIFVATYPNVDLIVEDIDVCIGRKVTLKIEDAQDDVTYILYRNGILTGDSISGTNYLEFSINSEESAIYSIYAKNRANCNKMLTDSSSITASVCDLIIPKGFSPNNDGINDIFFIKGLDRYPKASLIIINRWGNKVFEERRYKNAWDGVATKGVVVGDKNLPVGTYYYILKKNDGTDPLRGNFFLSR